MEASVPHSRPGPEGGGMTKCTKLQGADVKEQLWRQRWDAMSHLVDSGDFVAQVQEMTSRGSLDHDSVQLGLFYGLLTGALRHGGDSDSVSPFTFISMTCRDGYAVVKQALSYLIISIFPRLHEPVKEQMLVLLGEMLRIRVAGLEEILAALLRRVVGGDTTGANIMMCDMLVNLFSDNLEFLESDCDHEVLRHAVVTFARVAADHRASQFVALQKKEAQFVASLFLKNMKEYMVIGRDLVRWFQGIAKLSPLVAVWKTLLSVSAPEGTGAGGVSDAPIVKLLKTPTPRHYLTHRIPFEAENQIRFFFENVDLGKQGHSFSWFRARFLNTATSESLIVDLLRFVCACCCPTKEMLASKLLPRWAMIGWLLSCSKTNATGADAKLALFYDWLFFKSGDSVMVIEPGLLVLVNSLEKFRSITLNCLEFLVLIRMEYYPPMKEMIAASVALAFKELESVGIISSVAGFLGSDGMDPRLSELALDAFVRLPLGLVSIDGDGDGADPDLDLGLDFVDDGSWSIVMAALKAKGELIYGTEAGVALSSESDIIESLVRTLMSRWLEHVKSVDAANRQSTINDLAMQLSGILDSEVAADLCYDCSTDQTPLTAVLSTLVLLSSETENEVEVEVEVKDDFAGAVLMAMHGSTVAQIPPRYALRFMVWMCACDGDDRRELDGSGAAFKDQAQAKAQKRENMVRKIMKTAVCAHQLTGESLWKLVLEALDTDLEFVVSQVLPCVLMKQRCTTTVAPGPVHPPAVVVGPPPSKAMLTSLVHGLISVADPSIVTAMCLSLGRSGGSWALFGVGSSDALADFLVSTLEWDAFEQMVLWQLLEQECSVREDKAVFVPEVAAQLIPLLDSDGDVHHEALAGMACILGQAMPESMDMVARLLDLEPRASGDGGGDSGSGNGSGSDMDVDMGVGMGGDMPALAVAPVDVGVEDGRRTKKQRLMASKDVVLASMVRWIMHYSDRMKRSDVWNMLRRACESEAMVNGDAAIRRLIDLKRCVPEASNACSAGIEIIMKKKL